MSNQLKQIDVLELISSHITIDDHTLFESFVTMRPKDGLWYSKINHPPNICNDTS